LAILDGSVSRREWPYHWLYAHGEWGYVEHYLQTERAISEYETEPRIVIFGDSHAAQGIFAPILAKELNLPASSVINAGVGGGTIYDCVLFEKRNLRRLQQAPLIIYCVDIGYFKNGNSGSGFQFGHFANLSDRLTWSPSPYNLLVGVFRTVDKQLLFKTLLETVKRTARNYLSPPSRLAAPVIDKREAYNTRERVDAWCATFELSLTELAQFKQLLSRRKNDGQQVLLLQVPCRADFMRELSERYSTKYAAYKNAIRQMGEPYLLCEDASICGLQDHDFRDCDHLAHRGAFKFASFLGDWLKRRHPDLVAAAQAGIGPQTTDSRR